MLSRQNDIGEYDDLTKRLRTNRRRCPHCGGRDIGVTDDSLWSFSGNRLCTSCGCRWSPGWPKAAALVSCILGAGLFVGVALALVKAVSGDIPTDSSWGGPDGRDALFCMSALMGPLAVGMVIQGVFVLWGKAGQPRVRKTGVASMRYDTIVPPPGTGLFEAAAMPIPPRLAGTEAARIVDDIAARHKVRSVTDATSRKKVREARRLFAYGMEEAETVLYLNELQQFLVTDRAVYCGTGIEPICLRDIRIVTQSKWSLLDHGHTGTDLFIDGVKVIDDAVAYPPKFLIEVLEALGQAARKAQSQGKPDPVDEYQLAMLAANGVLGRRKPRVICRTLVEAGMYPEAALHMVRFMRGVYQQPYRKGGLILMAAGALVVGTALLVIYVAGHSTRILSKILTIVAFGGVLVALRGVQQLLTGRTDLDENALVAAWHWAKPPSRPSGSPPPKAE